LRYTLVDSALAFEDEHFLLDQRWPAHKATPETTGPFGMLPVLAWNQHRVGQTLAIASYLGRRLGHYESRSPEEIAELEGVTSAAYTDFTNILPELLRPRVMPAAAQFGEFFEGFIARVPGRLPAFERLLAARSGAFFGGREPAVADYFVFEAIDAWLELLGAHFSRALEACPLLREQRTALSARRHLSQYLASGNRPLPFTGSPHEVELRERLRAHLAAR
jgi:hypothetical protein